MVYTLITPEYTDRFGNKLLYSSNTRVVKFYSTSGESWDKTGGGTTSWYLETTVPNDTFTEGLSSSKWVVDAVYPNTVSVDSGATFSVNDAEGYVYLRSTGLWSLSGNFHIRLGINESSYYDEYRSAVSFGLNITIGDNYNVRVARVRQYSGVSAGYQVLYTNGVDPKFLGWSSLSGAPVSLSGIKHIDIVREGSTIRCYVGSYLFSTITGSAWSGNAVVSIGAECTEVNKFSMEATYFYILEGSITPAKVFSSSYRSTAARFPDNAVLVVDDLGMSIIDADNYTLWMRFTADSTYAFTDIDSKLEALNGRIYCVTNTGLMIFDFPDDKVYKYIGSQLWASDVGLGLRNGELSFTYSTTVPQLMSDDVSAVSAKNISGHEVVAIATTSGINLIIDRTHTIYNSQGNPPATAIHISEENNLYWANYNPYSGGDLSYYTNVGNLLSASGTGFSRTSFYDSTTTPYALTSEKISCISSCSYGGLDQLAVGTDIGVNVLYRPAVDGVYVSSYGVVVEENPILDPCFSMKLGNSPWKVFGNSPYPVCSITVSNEWSTCGVGCLKLVPGNGSISMPYIDDYTGVYQDIDLTYVNTIYFDAKMVGYYADIIPYGWFRYQVLIDDTVYKTYENMGRIQTYEALDEELDVSLLTGVHRLRIRCISLAQALQLDDRRALFTNFRTNSGYSDYPILGGSTASIKGVLIHYDESIKKIVYSTKDGYGSVDLVDNTQDYFVNIDEMLNPAEVNGSDFVKYDDI